MGVLNANPPVRPKTVEYTGIGSLYLAFGAVFPINTHIETLCDHKVYFFDHHFFHMAGVNVDGKDRLFMREEKTTILAMRDEFGEYKLEHCGARARHLNSALEVLKSPDEVWEDNPKSKAKWVYVKEFVLDKYLFSVALVTYSDEDKQIVPVSSFACKSGDLKKWRRGNRIYP